MPENIIGKFYESRKNPLIIILIKTLKKYTNIISFNFKHCSSSWVVNEYFINNQRYIMSKDPHEIKNVHS